MKMYVIFFLLFLAGCHLSVNMDKFKKDDQLISEKKGISEPIPDDFPERMRGLWER
jgi:hypothetical protein